MYSSTVADGSFLFRLPVRAAATRIQTNRPLLDRRHREAPAIGSVVPPNHQSSSFRRLATRHALRRRIDKLRVYACALHLAQSRSHNDNDNTVFCSRIVS